MPGRFAKIWGPVLAVLAVIGVAAAIFALGPGLDPWITAQFYDGSGFPAESGAFSKGVRLLIWDASIALAALSAVMAGLGAFGKTVLRIPAHVWAYILTVYLLGPALLVNVILKAHWGRARPATTTEFGGNFDYTPFWQPGLQCVHNCSFTSGEAASAAALGIALFALMPFLTRGWTRIARLGYGAAAVVLPLMAALQRLAAGRHFASDVVFSILFVGLIAVALRAAFLTWRHAGRVTAPRPRGPC